MADNNDEIVAGSESRGIGDRLKSARQTKRITISEVSTQLRLTKETIVNLEAGRWELFHGRAYASGYFSNYVKFLGLPEQELLSEFNAEYKATETVPLDSQYPKSASHVPWLPAIILVSVLVVIWLAYQQSRTSQVLLDANEATSDDAVPEAAINQEIVPEVALEPDQQIAAILKSAASLPKLLPVEGRFQELAEFATPIPAAASETTIELQFSGVSWVEVTDADEQILLNKTMTAKDNVSISGKPPLGVIIGRASVVIVKYNNIVFDTAPYTRGDIARFVIEEES